MGDICIKKVTLDEIEQLQKIGKQTFFETFSSTNTEDDMKQYLDKSFSTNKISQELNNPDSEFYFATLDDSPVGYLKVNYGLSQTELKDNKALEIERIYVLQDFQGKKIGQLLYNKAIVIANVKQVDYIWLGVWENNQKAINFYTKNGFVAFDKHIFKLGTDEQTDIMMKLKLKE